MFWGILLAIAGLVFLVISRWDQLAKGFASPIKAEKTRQSGFVPMLSHWLPYRTFDPRKGIYHNANSKGFVLELTPLIGADERTGDIIGQFLSEGVPEGACIQIMQWMSPRIGERFRSWFLPRFRVGGIYELMARHRSEHLSKGVWESLSADGPFHLRSHRVFCALAIPEKKNVSEDELMLLRDSMISMLKSIDVGAEAVEPVGILALIDDLTAPTRASDEDVKDYNPFDSIADQAVRRDVDLQVEADRIYLRTERFRATGVVIDGSPEIGEIYPDKFDVRSYAVRNLPVRWAPWDTARLIGDPFMDKLRMPCPVATVLAIHYPDEEAQSTRAGYKFMRTTSLANSHSSRFMPNLRDQSREWELVQDQLRQGQKLVKVFYGVTAFSPVGKGDIHERNLKAVYKASGWDLHDERYMQMFGFMSLFPMSCGDGVIGDLDRMKRLRTMLTTTAANIAPFQGEYLGGPIPHLLLVGRRGQPFFWSPFENKAGNHNVAVIGKSGSGKSVALQEVVAALVGAGAKAIVIDDGRSFEHSCKLQNGDFVEFTMSSGFCLNPFSMIDQELAAIDEDYRVDCMGMLKSIVGQMGRHMDRLDDTERGLIDGAVNQEWEKSGQNGSVDGVIAALDRTGHPQGIGLGISMRAFSSSGTYGRFFIGKASLRINAELTVFELSDLSAREELRSVVLTAIMFLSTQAMRADRSVRKAFVMDEAWQMLKGGSMAEFIETYARTCRKYGGALITATQSLNDYYKSEGSIAALENSDWTIMLQQKSETISDFTRLGRFEMSGATEAMMRSLKRNGAEYSDMLIRGPDTEAQGRLVLDRYSATVFSSSPQTYAHIEKLVESGLSMADAIERVAYPEGVDRARYDDASVEFAEAVE
ncbi:MAG: type IV secretion system protein TraC [Sphingomonadales bacterium]|nr:type IV secretion system protein TraC [Sphingomonadales bacterium]